MGRAWAGQLHWAASTAYKTGRMPDLLQDDCRGLSKWFASKPEARYLVRKHCYEMGLTSMIKLTDETGHRQWVCASEVVIVEEATTYGKYHGINCAVTLRSGAKIHCAESAEEVVAQCKAQTAKQEQPS